MQNYRIVGDGLFRLEESGIYLGRLGRESGGCFVSK